jgi:hypothetical protein
LDSIKKLSYLEIINPDLLAFSLRILNLSIEYCIGLLIKANQQGFKGVPLNVRLSTTIKAKVTYNKSYNIIGKITGLKHPDEVIIYTAHWDHQGIGKPDETGDSIYNGALDNSTATCALFELGRAFKSLKTKPERTIVFIQFESIFLNSLITCSETYFHYPFNI